jgi:hypothetical protein
MTMKESSRWSVSKSLTTHSSTQPPPSPHHKNKNSLPTLPIVVPFMSHKFSSRENCKASVKRQAIMISPTSLPEQHQNSPSKYWLHHLRCVNGISSSARTMLLPLPTCSFSDDSSQEEVSSPSSSMITYTPNYGYWLNQLNAAENAIKEQAVQRAMALPQ